MYSSLDKAFTLSLRRSHAIRILSSIFIYLLAETNQLSWIASNYGKIWDILGNNTASTNYGAIAYMHAWQYNAMHPYPHVIADDNRFDLAAPLFIHGNVQTVKAMISGKDCTFLPHHDRITDFDTTVKNSIKTYAGIVADFNIGVKCCPMFYVYIFAALVKDKMCSYTAYCLEYSSNTS
jgi:hypothetical protein